MRTPTLLLLISLLAVACGGATGDVGGADDGATGGVATTPVGDWVLASADPDVPLPDGSRATLSVGADGTASGDTPCNGYGGTGSWGADGTWTLGELAVTEMGCEPDRTAAQDAFLDALLAATAWSLTGSDTLALSGDEATLTFTRVVPVAAAALVGTDWRLHGVLDGDAVSSPTADVDEARLRFDGDSEGGTFTMSSGCRDFAGEWSASGDTITLPSWGQADASREVDDCSEAELEAESVVIGILESSFRAQVDGDTLEVRSTADDRLGLLFQVADGEGPDATATDEEAREVCEAVIAMSEDGDGYATPEEALTAFIAGETGWWTPPGPGFGVDGTAITLDGEPVGEVYLFQFRNGTWAVSGYEVCYPADIAEG